MTSRDKATRIRLADFSSAPMRAFHMTWIAFFLCFFGWFGIAPLMPVIRQELHLSRAQIGNLTIASVATTVLARLLTGWLCDRIGPRRAYTWLLILGSLPVMGVGLAHDCTTFLIFRLAIGAIGASASNSSSDGRRCSTATHEESNASGRCPPVPSPLAAPGSFSPTQNRTGLLRLTFSGCCKSGASRVSASLTVLAPPVLSQFKIDKFVRVVSQQVERRGNRPTRELLALQISPF